MWNDKISLWFYGIVWLCQDMIGISYVEISCISVDSRSKTNRRLHFLNPHHGESSGPFEISNKLPEQPTEDFTKGTGVKKKFDDFVNVAEINYFEILNNRTSDIDSPYLISFGQDPFGSSFPWNGQEILPTNFFQNENISSESYKAKNVNNKVEIREKRGVTHLYNMIQCATGCNPLSYKGYGCYCGFLGSGNTADPIDRCCMRHDACYTNVNCPVFSVYVTPYLWRCWNGYPQCALDHIGFGGHNSCASQLCQCDKQLALCLANWPCPNRRALCRSSPFRLLQNLLLY